MERYGVVGGGMIGASLAALFAGNGIPVTVVKRHNAPAVREACRDIYQDLEQQALMTAQQSELAMTYIHTSSDYGALASADFIFECVFEDIAVKQQVYRALERHCTQLKAIASSTSAISADTLADGLENPAFRGLLAVAHPWNPPHLAPCVELVKSRHTTPDAAAYICSRLEALGKKVIVLQKDIPGFIGNRLQYAMLREAIHIVESGAATPEMVDEALRYSFAPRYTSIGIFEHFDNCGQDLTMDICNYLFPTLCSAKEAQASVRENCAAGRLGIKCGQGMLDWSGIDITAFRKRAAAPYYSFLHWNFPEIPADG